MAWNSIIPRMSSCCILHVHQQVVLWTTAWWQTRLSELLGHHSSTRGRGWEGGNRRAKPRMIEPTAHQLIGGCFNPAFFGDPLPSSISSCQPLMGCVTWLTGRHGFRNNCLLGQTGPPSRLIWAWVSDIPHSCATQWPETNISKNTFYSHTFPGSLVTFNGQNKLPGLRLLQPCVSCNGIRVQNFKSYTGVTSVFCSVFCSNHFWQGWRQNILAKQTNLLQRARGHQPLLSLLYS